MFLLHIVSNFKSIIRKLQSSFYFKMSQYYYLDYEKISEQVFLLLQAGHWFQLEFSVMFTQLDPMSTSWNVRHYFYYQLLHFFNYLNMFYTWIYLLLCALNGLFEVSTDFVVFPCFINRSMHSYYVFKWRNILESLIYLPLLLNMFYRSKTSLERFKTFTFFGAHDT